MRRIRDTLLATVLLLLLPAVLYAQDDDKGKPRPRPNCTGGSVYDDGRLENGLRPLLFPDNFVQLVEAPFYPAKLEKVCIAWRRTGFDREVFFQLRIWAADGPDGAPGTRIDTIPVLSAGSIPGKARFYTYDLTGFGIVIEGPVYIGPFWDPLDYFLVYLATDYGPKTPRRRAFHNVGILDDHPPDKELGISIDQAPRFRAFGIRAVFGPP